MTRVFLAGVVGVLIFNNSASAQFSGGIPGPSTAPGGPGGLGKVERKAPEQAPPSVPGSRAEPSGAALPQRPTVDMPPTEALFDAINRGDLAGAKEAISRGADIQGRNVLGLTPLELAVDLGRNNISFLLLSLRGESGYSASRQPPAQGTAAGKPPTSAERRAADRAERRAREKQEATNRTAPRQTAPAPPRNAHLFAGDGGTPVPQAGFLGFDSAR